MAADRSLTGADDANSARKTAGCFAGLRRDRRGSRPPRSRAAIAAASAEDEPQHEEATPTACDRRTPCEAMIRQPAPRHGAASTSAGRRPARPGRRGAGGRADRRRARGRLGSARAAAAARRRGAIDVLERRHDRDGSTSAAGRSRRPPREDRRRTWPIARSPGRPSGSTASRRSRAGRRAATPGMAVSTLRVRRGRRRRSTSSPTSIWPAPSPNRSASSGHRPLPDQPAGREDADPVADATGPGSAGGSRAGSPCPRSRTSAAQQVEDLDDAERVDRGRRLVEDQDVRVLDQRVGDAEALEHAARVGLDRSSARSVRPTWSRTASIAVLGLVARRCRLRRAV